MTTETLPVVKIEHRNGKRFVNVTRAISADADYEAPFLFGGTKAHVAKIARAWGWLKGDVQLAGTYLQGGYIIWQRMIPTEAHLLRSNGTTFIVQVIEEPYRTEAQKAELEQCKP